MPILQKLSFAVEKISVVSRETKDARRRMFIDSGRGPISTKFGDRLSLKAVDGGGGSALAAANRLRSRSLDSGLPSDQRQALANRATALKEAADQAWDTETVRGRRRLWGDRNTDNQERRRAAENRVRKERARAKQNIPGSRYAQGGTYALEALRLSRVR